VPALARDVPIVRVSPAEITDWPTFHDVFARIFGFPDFYRPKAALRLVERAR
jgi:hypothetical protein